MEATAKSKKGKGDAAGGEEDLSMEEILQSIRKIISDDDAPQKQAAADAASVPGSSVLELTEMIKEDGTVESLKAVPAAPTAPAASAPVADAPEIKLPPPPPPEPKPADVLTQIDDALGAGAASAAPAPTPTLPPISSKPSGAAMDNDTLLSSESTSAATNALHKLESIEPPIPPLVTTPSPVFSSGMTVETMVVDMLKPMMKSWLDKNLPAIVERIVEREVRKLTRPNLPN